MTKKLSRTIQTNFPWILVIGGGLGLLAAVVLTLEKFALLKDPSHQLSCSLNPVLSCQNIIGSDQASAFGFPNPIIGLIGYAVVITVGMGLFASAKYKSWFHNGLLIGSIFGVLFVKWLMYQSLYTIGALCIYCMLVWIVTIPIFWYTLLYNLREGHLKTPASLKSVVRFMDKHHIDILVAWYLLIIALIIQRFWYYWSTLL